MPAADLGHPASRLSPRLRATLATLGLGGLAAVVLVAHAFVLTRDTDLAEMRSPRRYWEDACAAAKDFLDYKYTPDPAALAVGFDEGFEVCRGLLMGGASRQQVRPWQFWRTIHLRPFIQFRDRLVGVPPFSDPGRARAAALGFRLLDGIAPFLVMWVGVFAAIPVLWWAAWEFARAGMGWAGAVFLVLLSGSPFFVECLTLTHSALAFYMTAIVAIAPLAVYATLSGTVTPGGLLVRALAAGIVLASSSVCRSASIAIVPGFLLALLFGGWRMESGRGRSRGALLAAAAMLLLAPYAASRPAGRHDTWVAMWEGLGDFDRTKGHYWDDEEAKRFLVGAGFSLGKGAYQWTTDETEAHFRRAVLRDVASDPVWFVRILARRLWATVTEEKLRAWSAKDWRWITASLTPNEGLMNKNYSWATPVNRFGSGRARIVVPVFLLMAPTIALLALSMPGGVGPRRTALRAASRRALAPVACVAAGALALPVTITSASMLETQAFAFAYFLGFALLVQSVARAWEPRA